MRRSGSSVRPQASRFLAILLAACAASGSLAAQAPSPRASQATGPSPSPAPSAAAKAPAPAASPFDAAALAPLRIAPEDIRIEQRGDAGYHLFVKARPGLGSILLVESTKDPSGKEDNYAYRDKAANPVNGAERRILDGAFIPPEKGVFSLVDSTPEDDAAFGKAFHVFIPWVAVYGYPDTRHGEIFMADGTFVGIRAFAKPFADYSGPWLDNPYQIRVTQRVLPGSAAKAAATDTAGLIAGAISQEKGKALDVVVCLDTTASMEPYISEVQKRLVPLLHDMLKDYPAFRIGFLLYKDYFEEYLTKPYPFRTDLDSLQRDIDAIKVRGGGDIPEAVNEALYASLTGYPWAAEDRIVVQVGDAPPHPIPRGNISGKDVADLAAKLSVRIVRIDPSALTGPAPSP